MRPSTDWIIGRDDEFMTGPSWNIIHLTGSGDELTATGTNRLSQRRDVAFASIVTLREGKIWRPVDYFGPLFEAAVWRAPVVELETERGSG